MIYIDPDSGFTKWLAFLSILVYIAFFAMAMGPVPWIYNSEIYPLKLRSTAASLSTTANWISNFLVSMTFLSIMSTNPGMVLAWIVLAMFGVATMFWVWHLIPETKGKKLEDILELFGIAPEE
jgi:SP family myo-inositol transporter-like MFS transporter 13